MESLLQAMMGHQARQQEQIDKHTEQIDKHTKQIKEQTAEIEKQNAGIRDLVVVSRAVLSSIQEIREVQRKDHEEWSTQMKELRDTQAATDQKLNILIDTVDRIVRRRNGKE
jgi:flagellar biosynthesis chaperone FliJ